MNQKKAYTDLFVMIGMFLGLSVLGAIAVLRLRHPMVIDETSIVGLSALLSGDSWRLCIQSLGGYYYRPGMVLLQLPIYQLFRNTPALIYPMLILESIMIVNLVPCVAYHLLRKYFGCGSRLKAAAYSVAGGLLPAVWLQCTYCRTEAMLVLIPWLIVWTLLALSHKPGNKPLSAGLAFLCILGYLMHTRGIVYSIAVVMTCFGLQYVFHIRTIHWKMFFLAMIVLFIPQKLFVSEMRREMFLGFSVQHGSIERLDFKSFLTLLTPSGLLMMFRLCLGWTFSMVSSTFGLVTVGFFALCAVLVKAFRYKAYVLAENTRKNELVFSLFGVLNFLGAFSMGALFFYMPVTKTFETWMRADRILYERYMVVAVGLVCVYALFVLFENRNSFLAMKGRLVCAGISGLVILLFVVYLAPRIDGFAYNARYFQSLIPFLDLENFNTTGNFPHFVRGMALFGGCSLAVLLIVYFVSLSRRKALRVMAFVVLIAVAAADTGFVFEKYRMHRDQRMEDDYGYTMTFIQQLPELELLSEQFPNIVLDGGLSSELEVVQLRLPMFDCCNRLMLKNGKSDNCLIVTSTPDKSVKTYNEKYGEARYYSFENFDNPDMSEPCQLLIRGESLAEFLRENGCEVTEYAITEEEQR